MFPKLLAMYSVARAGAAVRAGRHTRARAGTSYFPAANIRYVPRLHAPLECRWRIDPMTGALSAFWLDPSAVAGTRAAVEPETIDARRWFAQSRQAARGHPAPRLAA
ncbi:MAG: hypothetical protein ACREDD_03935 [Methylocella sp.]